MWTAGSQSADTVLMFTFARPRKRDQDPIQICQSVAAVFSSLCRLVYGSVGLGQVILDKLSASGCMDFCNCLLWILRPPIDTSFLLRKLVNLRSFHHWYSVYGSWNISIIWGLQTSKLYSLSFMPVIWAWHWNLNYHILWIHDETWAASHTNRISPYIVNRTRRNKMKSRSQATVMLLHEQGYNFSALMGYNFTRKIHLQRIQSLPLRVGL